MAFGSIKCPMCNNLRAYNKNVKIIVCLDCHLKLKLLDDNKLKFIGFTKDFDDKFTNSVATELVLDKIKKYNYNE